MTEYVYEKKPRSVSQLKQYEKCPLSYKLARLDKEWRRPAAWLPQGIAVHAVAEQYLKRRLAGEQMAREEAHALFREEYAKETNTAADETPNLDWWFRSGPYRGEQDIERRWDIGLEQVDKLLDWIETHPEEEIWHTPDGTPGIELEIDVCFGDIRVRGFVDAIPVIGGDPRIRDYKTGNEPGDDFQLAVYAVALKKMYDVDIKLGEYWMAGKKGKKAFATHPFDLTDWTEEKITAKFVEMEQRLEAGDFEPLPEASKCQFCDVALACPFSMA